MKIDSRAGEPATASDLVDVPKLITAYYEERSDAKIPAQRVFFGKDGIGAALLAAEITAICKEDPGELYSELTAEFGEAQTVANQAFACAAPATRCAKLTS